MGLMMEAPTSGDRNVQWFRGGLVVKAHRLSHCRFAGGRMGLMLEAPTSGGGFVAEKEITHKLDTELNDEERAWYPLHPTPYTLHLHLHPTPYTLNINPKPNPKL